MLDKKDKIVTEDEQHFLTEAECDFAIGYLEDCVEIIYHGAVEEQAEEGHYIVTCEYQNGGQDVEWIVDKPKIEARPAWEEKIPYKRFHLYTEEGLHVRHQFRTMSRTQEVVLPNPQADESCTQRHLRPKYSLLTCQPS